MIRSLRSLLAINLTLAAGVTIVVLAGAPLAAAHLAKASSTSPAECVTALRIAGVLVFGRAIESAAISTQRAFESYREPVLISIAVRVLTLTSAIALAMLGAHTRGLLLATGLFLLAGCWVQIRQLRRFFGSASLWPVLYRDEVRPLLTSGVFLWMQAIGGVIFGYLDRILLGLSLGAETVTPYVLCIQFAQPVFGITASGLHFLFPHLAARVGSLSPRALQRSVGKALALNLLTVTTIAAGLLLFGDRFFRVWAGAALANRTHGVFAPIVIGSALTGLSITGIYALQALGQFRTVSIILLSCRLGMSLLMLALVRHQGIHGLVIVRMLYGASTLLVYVPLVFRLQIFAGNKSAVACEPTVSQLPGGSRA
jgi:O-antigen/teichoic acid export membrane protein